MVQWLDMSSDTKLSGLTQALPGDTKRDRIGKEMNQEEGEIQKNKIREEE